ncbi:MAG: hypothetical protein ACJATI_003434 [Halioglobus sp.]|jgi:hypothetical protein
MQKHLFMTPTQASENLSIKLSQGTISNKLASLTSQCMPMYQQIKARVESSKVIGADESGCVVNSEKWWMWT